ncbi:phosphoribosylamine--glycine ligase [Candidatus Daviesbacteria bacterium]|nr:phosphoribosylamine--glycine ligase [Candidatus Daviesbacteria bacterium]
MMCRIAVLISNKGTGTNLQAIIDGVKAGKIQAKIVAVVSDTPDTPGLKRANKYNLPIKIVPKKDQLLGELKKLDLNYICLAGWKQIILDEVIEAYPNKILNLHPGLIPDAFDGVVRNPDDTKGLWNKGKLTDLAIQQFIESKATYAGSAIHFLTKEFDFGPVLGRVFEKVKKEDTVESLYKRLKVKENKLYVAVLAKLCSKKTILITDAGGRGAALVDKYAQSDKVGRILVVPGNDLMQINTVKPVLTFPHLKTTSTIEILDICKKEKVDLVDVSQDNAVAVGLVDEVGKKGITVFGPTRKAGQIEWDKAWARDFMAKYKIPSPKSYKFTLEEAGIDFAKKNPSSKWFVKAAGLAEGKGAIPASNLDEAIAAIKEMKKFGKSGETYLLEEWLVGEEFSAFALCDGKDFKIVGFAQDHKRVNDGDKGPNTGGMGCVSNPKIVNKDIEKQVDEIFKKTIAGVKKEGRPYKGVLYLGGIVVDKKVYIIEFNARWGDPEAEVILPSIQNDLYEVGLAIISGKLNKLDLRVDKKVRVVIAASSKGYPVDYSAVKGKKVLGIEEALKLGVKIYGAGIKKADGDYVVAGGRVLYVVGEGKNIIEAREKAYQAMELISIEGNNLHFRKDIGWRDLKRMEN